MSSIVPFLKFDYTLPAKYSAQSRRLIALVGLSGSGKSALAAALAQRLGGTWVDTDRLLAQQVGKSLADILACDGEAYLRAVEGEILYDLLHHATHARPCIIATGCSIVMREANRRLLQRMHVTWLDASTPTLLRRLALSTDGTMQPNQPAYARVESLRAAHAPYYRKLAGQPLNTDGLTAEQAAELIVAEHEHRAVYANKNTPTMIAPMDVAS
jgi:shikimate kinase